MPPTVRETPSSTSKRDLIFSTSIDAVEGDTVAMDELGHELDSDAQVWKVFKDEALDAQDKQRASWNGTLDQLVIFVSDSWYRVASPDADSTLQAALFSAVVGSFAVDSYKSLQVDSTAKAINALASVLAPGTAHAAVPFQPTVSSRLQNGLWFASLVISISTALVCILVKQWLAEWHTPRSAESMHHWVQINQFRKEGIENWRVPTLIGLLPLSLHLSVFLFFSGLVLFLWNLDKAVAGLSLAVVLLLAVIYGFSVVSPLIYPSCPYKTPLLPHLRRLVNSVAQRLSLACYSLSEDMAIASASSSLSGEALAWLGTSQSIEIYQAVVRAIGAAVLHCEGLYDSDSRSASSRSSRTLLFSNSKQVTTRNSFISSLLSNFAQSKHRTFSRIMQYSSEDWGLSAAYHFRAKSALVQSGHCTAQEITAVAIVARSFQPCLLRDDSLREDMRMLAACHCQDTSFYSLVRFLSTPPSENSMNAYISSWLSGTRLDSAIDEPLNRRVWNILHALVSLVHFAGPLVDYQAIVQLYRVALPCRVWGTFNDIDFASLPNFEHHAESFVIDLWSAMALANPDNNTLERIHEYLNTHVPRLYNDETLSRCCHLRKILAHPKHFSNINWEPRDMFGIIFSLLGQWRTFSREEADLSMRLMSNVFSSLPEWNYAYDMGYFILCRNILLYHPESSRALLNENYPPEIIGRALEAGLTTVSRYSPGLPPKFIETLLKAMMNCSLSDPNGAQGELVTRLGIGDWCLAIVDEHALWPRQFSPVISALRLMTKAHPLWIRGCNTLSRVEAAVADILHPKTVAEMRCKAPAHYWSTISKADRLLNKHIAELQSLWNNLLQEIGRTTPLPNDDET